VFPSKVVALFEEAKASCTQDYCGEFCGSVSTLISEGKLDAAQNQLQSANSKCSCAAAAAAAITAARFGQAKDLYDRRRFAEASKEFTAMLALDPTDQVARGYLVLSRIELELVVRQAFSDWRENFDSRQYDKAAAAYELIRSSNVEPLATQLADLVTFEYQTALSVLVRSWKDACTSGDRTKMDAIKKEAVTLASGAAIDPTALGDMGSCVQQGCFHSDPVLAINRLKTRVSPQIEPALQRYISRGIRVDIQIDESGNVKVKQIANANPRLAEALKSAIEQWKFYPAIVDSQPRCVETELPIAFVQP
jgi:Gram-negative bacterial TonB protein C-terminal